MEEQWVAVQDFPGYIISNMGSVDNEKHGRPMALSNVQGGFPTVGLFHDGRQYRRSVATLVAKHFPDPPERSDFTTVLHLDGDKANCEVTNLMWRPRWFVQKYNRELGYWPNGIQWNVGVVLEETGELITNTLEPSMKYGILQSHIHASPINETVVYPHGLRFSFL